MTATFIKELPGWRGVAKLYRMEPPLDGHEYVIASAVVAMYSGPETYLFPATADGDPEDYGELNGSQKGTLSHEAVLQDAGYAVAVEA